MKRQSKTVHGHEITSELDKIPRECPICHSAINPTFLAASRTVEENFCEAVYICPACQHSFISFYKNSNGISHIYVKSLPVTYREEKFSEEIEKVSPNFIAIYNQSINAESQNLDQLTGIGLRKALEFLIKDFLCNQHSDKTNSIKSSTLMQCINNFIEDRNLHEISKRAVWLGNDETHYIRKWEDKDINDLKVLINLSVNFIQNILLTGKYITSMDESNKNT